MVSAKIYLLIAVVAPLWPQTSRMAFVRQDLGVNHIYLMRVNPDGAGSAVQRLTMDAEQEDYPSWSPDGKRIAYQRSLNGTAIYVVGTDGTAARRLSPTPGFDVTPSWSPDGGQIVYTRLYGPTLPNQPPRTDIRIMNADGSGDHAVLTNVLSAVRPRWSVAGQIVFMSYMDGSGFPQIWRVNEDGTGLVQLTTSKANHSDPAWSPNGRRITFGSDREGGNKVNIFIMNSDGSDQQPLTSFEPPFEAGDTNWSSDGAKIAFEYHRDAKKQSDPNAHAEVWTMNADGSRAMSTGIPCSNVGCAPRWQPTPHPRTDPLYLIFMLEPGVVDQPKPPVSPAEAFDRYVDYLERQIGTRGSNGRQLGFGLLLTAWDQPPESQFAYIDAAFEAARRRSVAVHFAIETHYMWQTRTDLWNFFDPQLPGYDPANAANVEWTDWSPAAAFPARFLDWGEPQALAPHMCYASPTVRGEASRLAREVIGRRIAQRVRELEADGLGHLFSGITVTSEPSLDDYSQVSLFNPALAALIAQKGLRPAQLGYCSLTNLGYSRESPPPDLRAALARVNREWVELWAKTLANAGIAPSLLFTHVAALTALAESPLLNYTNAPFDIAFLDSAVPGFTTYALGPLAASFEPIYGALRKHCASSWAGTEASFFDGRGVGIDPEDYLRRHFDHGATRLVMNTGATGELAARLFDANWNVRAIDAYNRFLGGSMQFTNSDPECNSPPGASRRRPRNLR